MSADKHKKKARAFAWLREQRALNGIYSDEFTFGSSTHVTRNPSARWLVKKGLGRIKRRTYVQHKRGRWILAPMGLTTFEDFT